MSLEIERKFKVTKLPDELSSFPWHFIEQVYLKEETDQDQSKDGQAGPDFGRRLQKQNKK